MHPFYDILFTSVDHIAVHRTTLIGDIAYRKWLLNADLIKSTALPAYIVPNIVSADLVTSQINAHQMVCTM